MCAIEDINPAEIYKETQPKALKEYTCDECYRTIMKGERYNRITAGEGSSKALRWSTYRLCAHCEVMAGFMRVLCRGWPLGDLMGELREHWREGYASVELGRLIACMKHGWHGGQDPLPRRARAIAHEFLSSPVAAG